MPRSKNSQIEAEQSVVVSLEERRAKARRIGKHDILRKTEEVREEYIEELDALVPLKPLGSKEMSRINEIANSGVKFRGAPSFDQQGNPDLGSGDMELEIDAARQTAKREEANRHAVVAAWDPADKLTLKEVEEFPGGDVAAIAAKVFEISGATRERQEAAKRVRPDAGGPRHDPDAPDGGEDS